MHVENVEAKFQNRLADSSSFLTFTKESRCNSTHKVQPHQLHATKLVLLLKIKNGRGGRIGSRGPGVGLCNQMRVASSHRSAPGSGQSQCIGRSECRGVLWGKILPVALERQYLAVAAVNQRPVWPERELDNSASWRIVMLVKRDFTCPRDQNASPVVGLSILVRRFFGLQSAELPHEIFDDTVLRIGSQSRQFFPSIGCR